MPLITNWHSSSPCLERAHRYRRLDFALHAHTRFFGAAALVTERLHYVLHTAIKHTVSGTTRAFLSALGSELETRNGMLAVEMEHGRLGGPRLDAYIVFLEQSWVEERLQRLRSAAPCDYERVVHGVDRLLTRCRWSAPPWLPPSPILREVVAGLCRERRRPLEFARQPDREALGNGIIRALRR